MQQGKGKKKKKEMQQGKGKKKKEMQQGKVVV